MTLKDARDIDLVKLLDPFEDAGKLFRQRLKPLLGLGEAGEARHLAHGFLVDGHEGSGLTGGRALSIAAPTFKRRLRNLENRASLASCPSIS